VKNFYQEGSCGLGHELGVGDRKWTSDGMMAAVLGEAVVLLVLGDLEERKNFLEAPAFEEEEEHSEFQSFDKTTNVRQKTTSKNI
jgi:hypothetical protein